jgi:hypothetical protein
MMSALSKHASYHLKTLGMIAIKKRLQITDHMAPPSSPCNHDIYDLVLGNLIKIRSFDPLTYFASTKVEAKEVSGSKDLMWKQNR